MKRLVFLALSIPVLSIATLAQTPDASIAPTPSPASTLAASSPLPTPVEATSRLPNLHYMVEILATAVMLGSVLAVFTLVRAHQRRTGQTIGPRHIQFVSVCLIVPTILILGLEQVLSRETTATLIGGLTGYLLSGLGRYEPRNPPGTEDAAGPKTPEPGPESEPKNEPRGYGLTLGV